MKKSIFLGLASLMVLTSCGGGMEVDQTLGDGNVENDSIHLRYSMPSSLENGDKIVFNVQMEKYASKEEVSLALSKQNPLLTDTSVYTENILFSIPFEELEKTINADSLKIEHVFTDLSDYFEENTEKGTLHFVFHTKGWTRRNVTTYSSFSFHYNYSGDVVKILED